MMATNSCLSIIRPVTPCNVRALKRGFYRTVFATKVLTGRGVCRLLVARGPTCKWVSAMPDGIRRGPTIPSQINWCLGRSIATRFNLCNRIASSLFMWRPSSCNDRYAQLSGRIRNNICSAWQWATSCSDFVLHHYVAVGSLKTRHPTSLLFHSNIRFP